MWKIILSEKIRIEINHMLNEWKQMVIFVKKLNFIVDKFCEKFFMKSIN